MKRVGTLSIGKYGHGVDLINSAMPIEKGNYQLFVEGEGEHCHNLTKEEDELFDFIYNDLLDIDDFATGNDHPDLHFYTKRLITNMDELKKRIGAVK